MPQDKVQQVLKFEQRHANTLAAINQHETPTAKLSDGELKEKTQELRNRLHAGKVSAGSS